MSLFDKAREKLFGGEKADSEMQSASDQTREDIELASFVKRFVEEVRTQPARVAQEGIWMTNIAYLLGHDSVYYDTSTRQFRPSANTASPVSFVRRNRPHTNLMLSGAQNRLARMLKNPPRWDVRPNSMDEEDKEAAHLGEDIIGNVWEKQAVNRKRIEHGMWLQQCGHAYIGVSRDDQLGEALHDPATGEFVGYEGETRVDVVSAFEGFPDPLAKNWDEVSKFARAKVRKLDYFRTHYDRGELVNEEEVWLQSAQLEQRINSISTGSAGSNPGTKGAAIEISYYEKRSAKYPKGRHVIVANGIVLKNSELPVGEIPYVKFDDVVIGGKYYSESLLTHARPLQDQYNRNLAKCADWVNKLTVGKWLAARGHGLEQEALTDQSGEVVEYTPQPQAGEPKQMQVAVIPQHMFQERTDLKNDLFETLSLSQVSRGQIPSASIPGIGIQLLLEQDETRMGIEVEQHEHSWAGVGKLILKYEAKFAITPRKLKTRGADKSYRIKEYTGEDLRDNFDVTVIRGSTVPNSKVIHRQEIMNLFTQGLLGNPSDPAVRDKVLGMLQYGEMGEAWEDHHLTEMQIERDLRDIENGIAPEVDMKDNHLQHMIKKNRYRISEKWFSLSPESQALLQQNISQHSQMAVAQMHPELSTPPEPPPPLPAEVANGLLRPPVSGPPSPGMPPPAGGPVAAAPPAGMA
jgi:hypothetical protein